MHQELFLTENDHFHAMFITNYNWLKIICCQFVMKKKRRFFYNFICVWVSNANTLLCCGSRKRKTTVIYFGEILPFIQLTKVLKCTVFQKYKIKEWKRKIHLINWLTFSISILLFFMAFSHNMTVSSLSINKNYWKCLFVVKYNWSQPFVGLIPTNSY